MARTMPTAKDGQEWEAERAKRHLKRGRECIRYRGATYRVGQAVLVNPAAEDKSLVYIAQIQRLEPVLTPEAKRYDDYPGPNDDDQDDGGAARPAPPEIYAETSRVRVRWYYRPEEAAGGRRPFHAVRELLMSDHDDAVPLGALIGPARVLPLAEFARAVPLERRRLDPTPAARGRSRGGGGSGGGDGGDAGAGGAPLVEEALPTYFARLMYRPGVGAYVPDHVPVFCTCESAYCPDGPAMICCPACHEFYHPQCVGVSASAAERIRRELGLPSDPADVGASPPPPPGDAPPRWLCPACRRQQ